MSTPAATSLVLLMDDSPTVREILKIYLMKRRDLEFIEAGDGARGLQLARLMPVQLIITDIKMPSMDGFEFLAQLRADPKERLRKVPVVMVTGQAESGLAQRATAAGASAFLTKPVTPAAVQAIADRFIPPPP